MPYLLSNLLGTKRDPASRGGQKHHKLRRGRLCIGARSLGPAGSMIVSDSTYAEYRAVISEFVALKALEVKQLVGSLDGEELAAVLAGAKAELAAAPEEAAPAVAEAAAPAEEAPAAEEAAPEEGAPAKKSGRKAKADAAE
jgi:hypothetical protein